MPRQVSRVIEEYLESIYRLQERDGAARTGELVKLLKVAPGTITNTVERLEKEGLVTHEPYKGVKLTEEGLKIALQVIRRHRLSERLLTDLLKVDWDKVHNAACRLEHCITDDIILNLEKALGHPLTCPHGHPIPTKCGAIIEEESILLEELEPQEEGEVAKIMDEDPELLRYLLKLSLTPGVHLRVLEKTPYEGPVTVEINGKTYAISRKVAALVKVRRTIKSRIKVRS